MLIAVPVSVAIAQFSYHIGYTQLLLDGAGLGWAAIHPYSPGLPS